jgi:hypothetical protein
MMTRFIPDRVGGLAWRPYKTEAEIDEECEAVLRSYCGLAAGEAFLLPLSTDVLTNLIEAHAERLDLYADLVAGLEGLTEISAGRRPFVRIHRDLSTTPARMNRLRSTLAHEFYHLYFHAPLYEEAWKQLELFHDTGEKIQCTRAAILGGTQGDWREWQAAYGSGALLSPSSVLGEIVREHTQLYGHPPYVVQGSAATTLLTRVAAYFEISEQAAMVRLSQKKLLTTLSGYRQSILFPGEKASPSE